MALSDEGLQTLERLAGEMRIEIIKMLHTVKTGHPGGSLSAVEILVALYFRLMRCDGSNPCCPDRDRFIASKGHCAPAVYAMLARKGYFPAAELASLRQLGCMLQGHPDMKRIPGIDMSTGSLGMGLSVGVGMALSARLESRSYDTYVLLGDGELQEGQNWEAAMAAARFGLDNLIAVVDWNGVQLDGRVDDIMPLGDLRRKFEAFGWRVAECDGHSIREIVAAVDALKQAGGMPCALLARTVKGKGVSFMEGKNAWHGKAIEDADFAVAIDELGRGCR